MYGFLGVLGLVSPLLLGVGDQRISITNNNCAALKNVIILVKNSTAFISNVSNNI